MEERKTEGRLEGHDAVHLCSLAPLDRELFGHILEEHGIPYFAQGRFGSAFTMRAGNLLEEFRIFVPASAVEEAVELLKAYHSEADHADLAAAEMEAGKAEDTDG